ncbi:hypothetical protein LOTGIDRAFT_164089 [Lottia gigantea]|uniref:Uncharacterized protein n=1 Tax=Lottia gigantea TaxID=225164 RepID=V4BNP8_LOTGI|nr:hypothetical protein LOTGIDRAFT_164089 [Lottia gigantea]ESO90504.1 hypothetical protein LOTGIDRAFT_164089 [Lottia gigantea]
MSSISSASSFTKLKAAEEAEAAKVALRYHDLEQQHQIDLERKRVEFEEMKGALQKLVIMKKLDIAEAKLKAIEKVETQDMNSYNVIDQISVPDESLDHSTKVNTYLNSTNPPVLTPQTVISPEVRRNDYTSSPDQAERNLDMNYIPEPSLESRPTVGTNTNYSSSSFPPNRNTASLDVSKNSFSRLIRLIRP